MRHLTQARWPTPCHMRHSQNIYKIDSFLKLVLNICIIGNFFAGWGEWVIKEGAGILHQIYRFSGGVNIWGSRIHHCKSWYYLGPSQTSKVESFPEIVFGYRPLTFSVKISNLVVWLVPLDASKKHFSCFVSEVKILYLEKKTRNIYTRMLEFTFSREDAID